MPEKTYQKILKTLLPEDPLTPIITITPKHIITQINGTKTYEPLNRPDEAYRILRRLNPRIIISYPSEMVMTTANLSAWGWDGTYFNLPPRGKHEQHNLISNSCPLSTLTESLGTTTLTQALNL